MRIYPIITEQRQQPKKKKKKAPCSDQQMSVTFKMQGEENKYAGQNAMPVLVLTVQTDVTHSRLKENIFIRNKKRTFLFSLGSIISNHSTSKTGNFLG